MSSIEIQQRIQFGNKYLYAALDNLLSSRVLSKPVEIQLHMTIIVRSMVVYGSQCGPLRKTDEDRLHTLDRKVFWKLYGPCFDQDTQEWGKKHAQECSKARYCEQLKKSKLQWIGRVWKKPNYMTIKSARREPKR